MQHKNAEIKQKVTPMRSAISTTELPSRQTPVPKVKLSELLRKLPTINPEIVNEELKQSLAILQKYEKKVEAKWGPICNENSNLTSDQKSFFELLRFSIDLNTHFSETDFMDENQFPIDKLLTWKLLAKNPSATKIIESLYFHRMMLLVYSQGKHQIRDPQGEGVIEVDNIDKAYLEFSEMILLFIANKNIHLKLRQYALFFLIELKNDFSQLVLVEDIALTTESKAQIANIEKQLFSIEPLVDSKQFAAELYSLNLNNREDVGNFIHSLTCYVFQINMNFKKLKLATLLGKDESKVTSEELTQYWIRFVGIHFLNYIDKGYTNLNAAMNAFNQRRHQHDMRGKAMVHQIHLIEILKLKQAVTILNRELRCEFDNMDIATIIQYANSDEIRAFLDDNFLEAMYHLRHQFRAEAANQLALIRFIVSNLTMLMIKLLNTTQYKLHALQFLLIPAVFCKLHDTIQSSILNEYKNYLESFINDKQVTEYPNTVANVRIKLNIGVAMGKALFKTPLTEIENNTQLQETHRLYKYLVKVNSSQHLIEKLIKSIINNFIYHLPPTAKKLVENFDEWFKYLDSLRFIRNHFHDFLNYQSGKISAQALIMKITHSRPSDETNSLHFYLTEAGKQLNKNPLCLTVFQAKKIATSPSDIYELFSNTLNTREIIHTNNESKEITAPKKIKL